MDALLRGHRVARIVTRSAERGSVSRRGGGGPNKRLFNGRICSVIADHQVIGLVVPYIPRAAPAVVFLMPSSKVRIS